MQLKRKMIALFVAVILILGTIATLAATPLYPNALVEFSGIQLVTNKKTGTTQGFIDITLKNVNASGISFCFSYNKAYLQLSDAEYNVPIGNPETGTFPYDTAHTYFVQNTAAFPDTPVQSFLELPQLIGMQGKPPVIGVADADSGHLLMNFSPIAAADPYTDYIEMVGGRPTIMANTSAGVQLGRLSFYIPDPVAFSRLTPTELESLIQIIPFSTMIPLEEGASDTGVDINYYDVDDAKWYSHADYNIDYVFKIKAELSGVKADPERLTVSAYEIYNIGKKEDLLDFINDRMSKLLLMYGDGSVVPAMFKWTSADSDIGSITWDPKGGGKSYTVTQRYNDDINVSVTVIVESVTLTDFQTTDTNRTYLYGGADFPQTFGELNLPQKAKAVFDTYLPNGGIADVDINSYMLDGSTITDLPSGFNSNTPQSYTFMGQVDDILLAQKYPWLTLPSAIPEIKATRNVVTDSADMPKELEVVKLQTSTDNDGVLTIVVKNKDGTDIPDGTTFSIKLQDGSPIDTAALGNRYTVTIASGEATIVIDPDPTVDGEEKLTELINLGDRAGKFQIASQEPSKHQGDYTSFTSNPRYNLYLESPDGGDYEFDYSQEYAAMFPVKAGTSLPTTVTLPFSAQTIGTTYNGETGAESGALSTFTVDQWVLGSGDPLTAGSTVTVTGELLNTSYTNYGDVYNDNKVSVKIIYYVVENDGQDSIEDISDFAYNTQQEGYGHELQTHAFTVKNNGSTDIYGLSATISLTADKKEAFVVSKQLPLILTAGSSTELDITPKIGLPLGSYECTVTIWSNNAVLDTFKISFVVTDAPVYKIIITVDGQSADGQPFGTAETSTKIYTAEATEVITLIATPETDCRFVEWKTTNSTVSFENYLANPTTFRMPAEDVYITAVFVETLDAKLRATELYVKDAATETQNFQLHDENWLPVSYNPITREYFVAVPNNIDKINLWLKPRTEVYAAAMSLTNDHNGLQDSYTVAEDLSDSYFKAKDVALEACQPGTPIDNLLTLSLTYNDPTDSPDEGERTKSYTIHVYRMLTDRERVEFEYGNSPYGLIMSDSMIGDKGAAWTQFEQDGYKFTAATVPANGIQDVAYNPKAWTSVHYDKDESALFVINTEDFVDPGYKKLYNSLGEPVTLDSKSITVNVLEESDPSMQNGGVMDFMFIASKTFSSKTSTLPLSGAISNLKTERIRPDCYEIVYGFIDFDGKQATVSKPLILLSALGDVNVSKAADDTDVSRIQRRFQTEIASGNNVPDYAMGGALFKYRVCDVNKDGSFNAVDANNVRAKKLTPFYKNPS